MKKTLVIAAVLLGFLPGAFAVIPEVYLTANPTTPPGGGTGTATDPYDVSTATFFDGVMSSTLPTTFGTSPLLIHIAPGNYTTGGGAAWQMQDGWTIQGSGIDRTIITLANGTPGKQNTITGGNPYTVSMEVTDLTVDNNLANSSDGLASGCVYLNAIRTRIERVKAIHFGGNDGETFAIMACTPSSQPGFHIIRDCIVAQPGLYGGTNGPGSCGVNVFGQNVGAIVEGCTAYGDGTSHLSAVSLAGSATGGMVVRDNTAYDCFIGFHFDTTNSGVPTQGLQITGNHFFRTLFAGVHLNGEGNTHKEMQGIRVEGNEISVTTYAMGGIYSEAGLHQAIIRSNVVRRSYSATSGGKAIVLGGDYPVASYPGGDTNTYGNVVEDNRCEVGMTHNLLATYGFGRDNYDVNGVPFYNDTAASPTSIYLLPPESPYGTPTATANAGAGTIAGTLSGSPSATLDALSDDKGMKIIVRTGTNPASSGNIATITFGHPYKQGAFTVISPANQNACALNYVPSVDTVNTIAVLFVKTGSPLAPNTEYKWNVIVSGK